jgi:2,3-dihydro-2,3-dihydroxybenzoate dehydrogenase
MSDGTLPDLTLVTGAASGIGLAIAEALCRAGARVAASDFDVERLNARVAALRSELGAEIKAYPLDVRDATAVERTISEIEQCQGAIDGLAHAAGILRMGTALALVEQAWLETFSTNVGGVFHITRAVGRRMSARKRGAIVVVASNAAHTPRLDMAAYASAKAAALMFTRCLGLELAEHGVRCNVVSPGSTDTPMQRAFWGDTSSAQATIAGDLSRYRLGIPLARIAAPADVAAPVLFLLSEGARHVTLHELTVDGGATLQ